MAEAKRSAEKPAKEAAPPAEKKAAGSEKGTAKPAPSEEPEEKPEGCEASWTFGSLPITNRTHASMRTQAFRHEAAHPHTNISETSSNFRLRNIICQASTKTND